MENLETVVRGLSKVLNTMESPLVAILPQNNEDYAHAAIDGGADAIIIGIDKTESSFPGLFGSFDLQEDAISSILSTSSVPVGISIGDSRPLTPGSWERVASRPFGFVNMYAHHMPPFVLQDERVEKLVTIGSGYMVEQIRSMSEMPQVSAFEAAIVSPQGRTQVFSVLDLATLRMISKLSSKPMILRAQKRLEGSDIKTVISEGLKGIALDPSALEAGVEAYKDAMTCYSKALRGESVSIDSLPENAQGTFSESEIANPVA
jgi:hypothetical protein